MGSWSTVDARAARIARPVEFEDVSLAIVTYSGAAGTVVTSLLCPQELSRIRIDTTGGTLEVNHVSDGYGDADWSWTPAPDATTAAGLGRDPGLSTVHDPGSLRPTGSDDVWAASAGLDLLSNHAAQIDQLVDDMLGWPAPRHYAWPAPVRQWSSSQRSTHRRSSAKQFTDAI